MNHLPPINLLALPSNLPLPPLNVPFPPLRLPRPEDLPLNSQARLQEAGLPAIAAITTASHESNSLKRKQEQEGPQPKRARTLAANGNRRISFCPEGLNHVLKTVIVEVPNGKGMAPWQFIVSEECFAETFITDDANLSSSSQSNKIIWQKTDEHGNAIDYYHPQAVAHVLHFATHFSLNNREDRQYKKLAERKDAELVKEILPDILELALRNQIEPLEHECAEFIAMCINQDCCSLSYYINWVPRSLRLEQAWRRGLFNYSWTAEQKLAISERIINLLINEDLLQSHYKLISDALIFVLTKEVVEQLSSQSIIILSNYLPLLDSKRLFYAADLIAKRPSAPPIFSLAAGFFASGQENLQAIIQKAQEALIRSPRSAALLIANALLNKNNENALTFLDRLLEGTPSRLYAAQAHYLKAQFYFQRKQFTDAFREIDQAAECKVEDIKIANLKGSILLSLGRLSEAVDYLQRACLTLHKEMDVWAIFSGRISLKDRQQLLIHLQQSNKQDYFTLSGIAIIFFKLQKYDHSLGVLNQLLALNPSDSKVFQYKGCCHLKKDNLSAALANFGKALELNPISDQTLGLVGDLYLNTGHFNLAQIYLNKASQLNPADSFNLSRKGEVCRKIEDFASALIYLDQAIKIDPNCYYALLSRGKLHFAQCHYDLAVADLSRVIAANPNDIKALETRGDSYRLQGQFDSAIADFTQAIRLNSRSCFALARRGEVYLKQGQHQWAFDDLRQALEIDAGDIFALGTRGEYFRLQKQYWQALLDLNKALAKEAADPFSLGRRGDIYIAQGRLDLAFQDLDQAARLDPDDDFVLARKGYIYLKRGQDVLALMDLDKALQLNSNNAFALTAKAEFYQKRANSALAFEGAN